MSLLSFLFSFLCYLFWSVKSSYYSFVRFKACSNMTCNFWRPAIPFPDIFKLWWLNVVIENCLIVSLYIDFLLLYAFQDLAFDLSLSALLGDNIYNFGELLAHPIVSGRLLEKSLFFNYLVTLEHCFTLILLLFLIQPFGNVFFLDLDLENFDISELLSQY